MGFDHLKFEKRCKATDDFENYKIKREKFFISNKSFPKRKDFVLKISKIQNFNRAKVFQNEIFCLLQRDLIRSSVSLL